MILPNKLAYTRSLSPSIAIFLSVDSDGNKKPLAISTVKLIGQKSSASEAFDKKASIKSSTTKSKLAEANPHTVEFCHVPYESKSLLCQFSLRINANSVAPLTCNDESVEQTLRHFSRAYNNAGGYRYLAKRYIENLLNGCWLWRNIDAPNIDIKITTNTGVSVESENINANKFDEGYPSHISGYDQLLEQFMLALSNPKECLFVQVEARIQPALLQEIYPSQAFTEKDKEAGRIYQDTLIDDKRSAILGSYKIGAALATIDDWYPNAENKIRVGAFGIIKDKNTVTRHPNTGKDLYSALMNIEKITAQLNHSNIKELDDAHFLAANLIKGGLFQLGR